MVFCLLKAICHLAISAAAGPLAASPFLPPPEQAGDSDKRLQEKLAAEAAAFAALDPEAAATQMPKMQVRLFLCFST